MRASRRSVSSLLLPVIVMISVVSLLLFFYSDTQYQDYVPHHHFNRHSNLAESKTFSKLLHQNNSHPQPPSSSEHSDVISADTSSVTSKGRRVIVLSLARSGSSFTGDILSHAHGVFYVFEPLKRSEELMWAMHRDNETEAEKVAILETWRQEAVRILRHFLSCDFSLLDLQALDSSFLQRYLSSRPLAKCVDDNANNTDVTECLLNAETSCTSTDSRILKVVRLRLRDLEPLLTYDPDLAVILLVRDPRASLWSRVKTFKEDFPNGYRAFFHKTCINLQDDVNALTELRHTYPERIRIVRYETLAEEPVRMSKLLYQYLGLKWSSHVQNLITDQTNSSRKIPRKKNEQQNRSEYGVYRDNSAQASQAWREKMYWSFAGRVQEQCFEVMSVLGYTLFRGVDDLKDEASRTYIPDHSAIDEELWLQ